MISNFGGPFLTYLPTHIRFFLNLIAIFTIAKYEISDFHEPIYLPKNRMSYVDSPLCVNYIKLESAHYASTLKCLLVT